MSDSKLQSNNSGEGISDDPCAICLGDIDNLSTTDVCSHKFCFQCIERWSEEKNVCPVCKRQFAEIFHDFNEDRTHSTLKVRNTNAPLGSMFVRFVIFGGEGIMIRELRRVWYRDSINEQFDHSVPQTVPQENRNSSDSEDLTDRVLFHILPSSTPFISDDSDTETEDGDDNPELENDEPSQNTEESEESTPSEPVTLTSNKRSRSDEDDQIEPQLKRHKN